ncbi:ATP-binding protein [Bizionia sediminis]|uniref:Oxygen sensor histidine kinase NreB n=1 Tax=Bizionia sediminis TaxID=1737064 RepID=A0ABW5KQV4_9FLAO
MFYNYLFFLLFGLLPLFGIAQHKNLDSVLHYRQLANSETYNLAQREIFIKKAIAFSEKTKQDTTILKSKRQLATLFLKQFAVDSLFNVNHENLKLAKKLQDTLAMAHINNVLGWYHSEKMQNDSSYTYYFNASKYFGNLQMKRQQASALNAMASIQFEERDYVGCETNAFKAIRLYQSLPSNPKTLGSLWGLFNLVAIASDELKMFDKAIEYHEKALSYSNQLDDNFLYTLYSKSNIALIYKEKKQFNKSLEIYKTLFNNQNTLKQDPDNYALILGDYALLAHKTKEFDTGKVAHMFSEAYAIADSLDNDLSKMSVALNASEFYLDQGNKTKALQYANTAYSLSKAAVTNDVILNALLLKAKIEAPNKAVAYLNEYIQLNDSLIDKERAIRDKFARIEFETEQIELEKNRISRERLWLLILSVGLIFTFILVYIILFQRSKNRQLTLIQQQQEANEEIYNLMLTQQDKVDEARLSEKKRISQDLHDGILGRLFGIRLSLDSLNFSVTDTAIKTREGYIAELKNIEDDLREVSHELNADFIANSGYLEILKTLIDAQTKSYQLTYQLKSDSDIPWENISNKIKIHVYRVLQESLQNIYKHAQASHVDISFKLGKYLIWLTISDNGSGFDMKKSKKGIGLKNMKARVSECGGKLRINSEINKGTTISIKIPF